MKAEIVEIPKFAFASVGLLTHHLLKAFTWSATVPHRDLREQYHQHKEKC